MKIIVFGATGKIGAHVTAQLLEAGHEVSAFTRSPEKIINPHENLRLFCGDVLDMNSVKTAMAGQDTVICALGMPITNKEGLRTKGTNHIVQAMEEIGVKRLICLSVYGASDSWDSLPIFYKYFIMPLILRNVVKDHNTQEKIIKNSGLDWTIIRPVNFTDGQQTGNYRHDFSTANDKPTFKISQADVADFMIKQINSNAFLHKAPGISY